jgi:hypothetical protein
LTAPNFETRTDSNGDGIYVVIVQVSDGQGGSDTQTISVTVTDVNDAPVITSNGGGASATISLPENRTAVTTAAASDEDRTPLPDALVYSIIGGADEELFGINSTSGALYFLDAPDYENPDDAGGDRVYNVRVQVSDGRGGTDFQDLTINLLNETITAPAKSYTAYGNTTLSVPVSSGLLSDAVSNGGRPLSTHVLTQPSAGSLYVNEDGSFTYVPAPNWYGTVTFTYRIFDGYEWSDPITVTIQVVIAPPRRGWR